MWQLSLMNIVIKLEKKVNDTENGEQMFVIKKEQIRLVETK